MTIVAHDTDTLVISSNPESSTWVQFLHTPSFRFYGACADEECGRPWVLYLETRELRQCGCEFFTPEEPFLPEVTAVLRELDTEPQMARRRWVTLGCGDEGCGEGTIFLDTEDGGFFVPCHHCGWSPLDPAFLDDYTAI